MRARSARPGVNWPILHDYQQHRVCTLLDPTTDPLGKGFHTIQSIIAIGSGGVTGKGWLKGRRPTSNSSPRSTPTSSSRCSRRNSGSIGNAVLLVLYLMLIFRGLLSPPMRRRCSRGCWRVSITLIFFTYAFVNMGMVSGILPVVGVPLPLLSYGGTALVTLGMGIGILMSISRQKRLIQT